MSDKLVQRYNEVTAELAAVRAKAKTSAEQEALRARLAALEAQHLDLKERLRWTALAHLRDLAWLTLAHGR